MSDFGVIQQHLSTIEMDGKPCAVSVRIAYDGIEYIGRLFFSDPETGDGLPDHGAIPRLPSAGRIDRISADASSPERFIDAYESGLSRRSPAWMVATRASVSNHPEVAEMMSARGT